MKKCATVVTAGDGTGTVMVRPERSASCGSCRACVGTGGRIEPLAALAPFPVRAGEKVVIESTAGTGGVILLVLKLFLFPLIGFWACFGLVLGLTSAGEGPAGLAGIAGFLLVFFLIRISERRRGRGERTFYRIISRIG